jgi:sugar phosphate isomerase/epimerase
MPSLGVFAKHVLRPTPEELFDALAEFGFDCTQFNAACLGIPSLPDAIDAALWRRAARAAERAGIKIVALSATFNLLDENEARLNENFRRLKRLAQGAAILDTDLLTLCSGTRYQEDMWTYHPQNGSPAAWEAMLSRMRQALEVAVEHGVNLGIEPEAANVVNSATAADRLIKELDSDRIRIVFDAANLYSPPADPSLDVNLITDALSLLGDRIVIAHCKDVAEPRPNGSVHAEQPKQYTHVAAGLGRLNYRHYLSELRRVVSRETPLILHGLDEKQIPGALAFIRGQLGAL